MRRSVEQREQTMGHRTATLMAPQTDYTMERRMVTSSGFVMVHQSVTSRVPEMVRPSVQWLVLRRER